MAKKQKPNPLKQRGKRRKNNTTTIPIEWKAPVSDKTHGPPGMDHFLANTAGSLAVSAALQGTSANEKLLVSCLIPYVLKLIRSVPKPELSLVVDKMFPGDGADPAQEPHAGGNT